VSSVASSTASGNGNGNVSGGGSGGGNGGSSASVTNHGGVNMVNGTYVLVQFMLRDQREFKLWVAALCAVLAKL
jgi:hypothetical protein